MCYLGVLDEWGGWGSERQRNHSHYKRLVSSAGSIALPRFFAAGYPPETLAIGTVSVGDGGVWHVNANFGLDLCCQEAPAEPIGADAHSVQSGCKSRKRLQELLQWVDGLGEPLLIVFNLGVHYNWDPEEAPAARRCGGRLDLCHASEHLVELCGQLLHASCLLSETPPQHFWRPPHDALQNGLYRDPKTLNGTHQCPSPHHVWSAVSTDATWRNAALHRAVRKYKEAETSGGGRGSKVSVLKVWDALAPRADANANGDCTHYARNLEFWEPFFIGIYKALRSDEQTNGSEIR